MLEINGLRKTLRGFYTELLRCRWSRGASPGWWARTAPEKSTTFKAALGLVTYDEGNITLMGKAPARAHRCREGEDRGYPGGIRVQRLSEGKGRGAGAGGLCTRRLTGRDFLTFAGSRAFRRINISKNFPRNEGEAESAGRRLHTARISFLWMSPPQGLT